MFSISAINDTDSKTQWEPLAPTKEAQEFHLTKTYHDGLLQLQNKEYEKARELLESVLKDPLIASALVDDESGESHLLQLRFLALKNLATVFLRQGSERHENALHCYLQAVEIDNKDSVVWNQLGTLSCSMGLLNISRWAFEQGLSCSPNNWNCMEKLLEVLIAIGDEVACLSVAELILRHWPSHSRALLVKNTIEELDPVPYAPRGIDKLKPNHVRLTFLDKRKSTDTNLDQGVTLKRMKKNIEIELSEISCTALADALLDILNPLKGRVSEMEVKNSIKSGDVNVLVRLPLHAESSKVLSEGRELTSTSFVENASLSDLSTERVSICKEKEGVFLEEQPQERRSTRLERLRSRKPGKEEIDFDAGKDLAKVTHYLEPFLANGSRASDPVHEANCSDLCSDQDTQWGTECCVVSKFLRETSNNYGAYHLGHLLLERASISYLPYQVAFIKFLELEKLTRHWGKERTAECNLFLAELYFDFASSFPDASKQTEFMLEASYHICKIIEVVALEYPWNFDFVSRHESFFQSSTFEGANEKSTDYSSNREPLLHCLPLENKKSFWVRFFWLSGKLSIWDGNRGKAYEELGISLSLLTKEIDMDSSAFVKLPHLRIVKKLTIDRILHDINILKVELLMEKTVPEMVGKQMFMECKNLLHPLLFSTNDVYVDPRSFHCTERMSEEFTSIELSALDVLRKSCEKTKPLDIAVYLNSHKRKLQILVAAVGMEEYFTSFKSYPLRPGIKTNSASEVESKERSSKHWGYLVAEEVKAISQCASEVKNYIDHSRDPNFVLIDPSRISDLQSLLLSVMCNIARVFLCKKSSGQVITDQVERCCFVDGAITFCKLQHLDLSVPLGVQVELIVAMHDLLAEYGLCCWGEVGSGEEGTFLKFAIKHLLALDMKLKAGEQTQNEDADFQNNSNNISSNQPILETSHTQMGCIDKSSTTDIVILESTVSEGVSSNKTLELDGSGSECANQRSGCDGKFEKYEKTYIQLAESGSKQNEEEKEELELKIDSALDQCFFCLYGLNLRCDSSYEDDLSMHKNTSRGDYQTKEQCADVLQYILPYAKASSRTGLVKLRRVLRAIRKHFPQPPEEILAGNAIDKFLDDSSLFEDTLSEEAGSDKFLEIIKKTLLNEAGSIKQYKASLVGSSEPYLDVYCNLYYFLALSEETNATDKWPGFVLTKEGEEFVQQNAKLLKYDLLYNPLRFESWQRLANIYDEEVDLLLNDGSKHINVVGWRKNDTLPQRVEISRRRSRRCLLMSLALAKSSSQQGEIHELLALVYYDSLQNVVPFYDQRSGVPTKDPTWILCCENSLKHFKKAFAHKQDWSHAFYMGKLSEKLGYSHEISLSHYAKAITLNPSAADPVYRMHASRLKLLCKCGIQSPEVYKVLSTYTFERKIGETVMEILNQMAPEISPLATSNKDRATQSYSEEEKKDVKMKMKEVWNILYNDCLSALESCVEGDLKHFHKARFMLAHGMYKRGQSGDLERAKDELSFCFKSSRSSFTINMWEIDSMVKKGRRKTPGFAGMKKILEVNLPESSRKFITCIRKYLLFYLKLLEETGDILTLERAYISLRADKRFSLCIEDLVPVSLGRYIKALIASIHQTGIAGSATISSSEPVLEKMFALFVEQGNLWPEICSLSEIKDPGISESILYGYLHEHIKLLERNRKLENLEAVNEKIRKRFKSSKLTNNECTKICKHASIAWSRCLIINLVLITPLLPKPVGESQIPNLPHFGVENHQLLCVDLQINEIWSSPFDDSTDLRNLQLKWSPILSKIKNIFLSKATDENSEIVQSLLRSSYNFYRESSCVILPSGVNLYNVPYRLATGMNFHPNMEGVEILDLSLPRKLLLWAYTLLHGHCANISAVVKHCEENLKSKTKKGHGNSTPLSQTSLHGVITPHTGVRDSIDTEASLSSSDATNSTNPVSPFGETQKNILTTAPQLHHFNNLVGERADTHLEGDPNEG